MAKQVATTDTAADNFDMTIEDGELVLDLSAIKPQEPIANGTYHAAVRACKLVPPTEAGKYPYFETQFQIRDEESDFYNRIIYTNLSFHPNARQITRDNLVALGVDPEAKRLRAEDLVGSEAMITVATPTQARINTQTNEPYPLRPEVKRIRSLSDVGDALNSVFR